MELELQNFERIKNKTIKIITKSKFKNLTFNFLEIIQIKFNTTKEIINY